jgi:cation diffusion facilitator CzcD-associated flavoprotein CzcO
MAAANDKPRVIIVGAGFSGLCLGHHLNRTGLADYTILEKAEQVGGTWRENTYPGAACDVPSMSYCFSFAQKTDWSRKWSPQPEILDYMRDCAQRLGILPHIRFKTEVASARFDEDAALWRVTTVGGEELEAEILVSGVGQLHRPLIPDVPGRDDFRGVRFHSARWRHDVDLTGKTVAVIGNAASAIQFIPQIARRAGKLLVFQRSANWMIRRNDRDYTDAEKRFFGRHPLVTKLYRWWIWMLHELRWPIFTGNRFVAEHTRRMAESYLDETIHDPELRRRLTPDYPIGAKRLLISDDYYDALARDNVELIAQGIERITPSGVVGADGREHPADVIIFATGFRTTEFISPMQITGLDDRTLAEEWKDGAEAYLGITVSGFPNFFMMYGPNTNLGHNSIIFMIECQTGYIIDCLRKLRASGGRWLDLRADVQRAYNDEIQRKLGERVWAKVGRSWYKNAAGRITNNWSGSTIEYWWKTRNADLSKYRIEGASARAERDESVSAAAGAEQRPAA